MKRVAEVSGSCWLYLLACCQVSVECLSRTEPLFLLLGTPVHFPVLRIKNSPLTVMQCVAIFMSQLAVELCAAQDVWRQNPVQS